MSSDLNGENARLMKENEALKEELLHMMRVLEAANEKTAELGNKYSMTKLELDSERRNIRLLREEASQTRTHLLDSVEMIQRHKAEKDILASEVANLKQAIMRITNA